MFPFEIISKQLVFAGLIQAEMLKQLYKNTAKAPRASQAEKLYTVRAAPRIVVDSKDHVSPSTTKEKQGGPQ